MSHDDHKSPAHAITEWLCWYWREIGAGAGLTITAWLLDLSPLVYLLVLLPLAAIGVQETLRLAPLALHAHRSRTTEQAEVA